VSENHDDDKTKSYTPLIKDTMVGYYRIIEKIGAGGMGEVYLAEDTKLNRKVALKFLPPHLCQDEDCRRRFTREAQAAAKLDHPNIVAVHEVGEFQGRPFFSMQHVEGRSLREVIKQGKLTVTETIALTMQICEGLQEAHEAGIIHRDIKPSNIIIDRKGRPKLLDFGLAMIKGTDKLTKTGSTLGTAGYMSPEQAEGKTVDQRSDLFSVGVVLYEMIAGRRPFDRESDIATGKAIVTDSPEPLARYKSDLPKGIQQIVDRALEKDTETRYQTASGMLADLKRLVSSEGIALPHPKKISRPTLISAILVLAIVIIWGGFQIKDWLATSKASAKSIAVVDFDNVGSEEDAYLASGLAEDLSIKLRQLEGIKVASSADIRRLAKENLLPREIASRLKVQYALSGSLIRQDSLIRVNVELIDRESGDVVWSDQINKQFTEIFQFLDEVSIRIAQALEVRLTPVEKATMTVKPTDNARAYDHYLRGRHYYYNITFRDNEMAEKEFELSLQLDPDYPLALAGLADVFVQRYKERFDYDEYWLDSSKVLILRALSLEPELAEAYESRAELFLQVENITGALKAAEKARQLRPNWDEPYIHLANIYKDKGIRNTAMALYDTALSLRASVDALCGKGAISLYRGQTDSAKAAYEAAIALNPDHDRPYLDLGGLYEELHKEEKAETLYYSAIEVRPDHVLAYERLSWRLCNEGRPQEGEGLLRKFVERFPYNWDGYRALYEYVAWWEGDYPSAARVVEEAVRRNPDRVWPHLLLASSYAEEMPPETESDTTHPMSEKAVQAVDRALALRPNSGRVLEWAGDVYCSLNRLEEAKEYYYRALKFRPGSSQLFYSIARIFWKMRQYEKAAEFMRKAIEQAPGRLNIYYYELRGLLIHHMNRQQEYLDITQQVAREYGDIPGAFFCLSEAQCASGQYSKAIMSAQRSLEFKRFYGTFALLGIALWMSGDTEGALTKFREACTGEKIFPADWIIAVLKSEGRFREIESYLRSIKQRTPNRLSGIDCWASVAGVYYMSMRRFDDALATFRELRESGKETWSVDTRLDMAKCYRQKGEIDSAKYILQKLADSSTVSYQPYILRDLALIEAISTPDLATALKLVERAQAKANAPDDAVTEALLRLQYATGKLVNAAKSIEQLGTDISWRTSSHPYRRAQLAQAIALDSAGKYLAQAITSLTVLSRSDWFRAQHLGEGSSFLALALARVRKPDEARKQVKRALKLEPEREDIAYNTACAYSLLGDTALALQWLKTAVDRGYLELWWAKVDPDLDPMRELPRFKEIMDAWDKRIQGLLAKSGKEE